MASKFRRYQINDPILGRRWLTVRRRRQRKMPERQGTVGVLGYDKTGQIDVDEWLQIPEKEEDR